MPSTRRLLPLALAALLLALGAVLLSSTRFGAWLLRVPLEAAGGRSDLRAIARTQAIVVLGGRTDRVITGAMLRRATGLPLLLSGKGRYADVYGVEAEKMAAILRRDYGIEPRWVEASSTSTVENAEFSWCLAGTRGVRRIALVTDPTHMLRARLVFTSVGFEVVPAPAPLPAEPPLQLRDLLPSAAGRVEAQQMWKEWAGSAAMLLEWFRHRRTQCPRRAA